MLQLFSRGRSGFAETGATNNKIRVGLLLNDMNAAGGIQRVAANLARDLGNDFETVILTVYSSGNVIFDDPRLTVKSLNLPRGPFYPRPREILGIGWQLRKLIAEERIDTVICFWFHWAIIAALALPKSVKKIGYEHIAFSAATGKWAKLRNWVYPRLDAVVSLAQEDSAQFAAISKRARVIPNYVELPEPGSFAAREKILLAVGHIEHRKGLDRLLWAMKDTLQANPDWKLAIVGGGDLGQVEQHYLSYLHALTGLLHLSSNVEFYPATHRINDWYRRASIMVMGSRLEGFPMVLLEAKSYGLPIVSYACPTGPREIVREGVDGFLIEDDAAAFGAAVQTLIEDAALRQRMGEAAREDVDLRFGEKRIYKLWHDLIEEVRQEAKTS